MHRDPSLIEATSAEAEGRGEATTAGRVAWAFVGFGIAVRIAYHLLDFPLWWDEAFVAANLLRRGYLGLLKPLDYGQVCPLLFLWAELTAVRWLGFAEWSLRLFPLACSIASLVLFRGAAGMLLGGRALILAVAIFAASSHPIRHGADLKPYASDALASLMLVVPALAWSRRREDPRPLWGLATVGPVCLLLSHPAAFVAVGVGLALVVPGWRSGRWGVRIPVATFGLVSFAVAVAIYVLFTGAQASAASPGMAAMWKDSFPPLDSIFGLARWLAVVHSGEMMAYPLGAEGGGSTASLLLGLVGAAVLWRRGRTVALGCLLGPLGVALVAAGLRRYPYGGPAPHGSAARIMQYAAPALCLLIGLGLATVLERVGRPRLQLRLMRVGLAGLVLIGLAPLVAGVRQPYRAHQAEAARQFARGFWPEVGKDAEVACLRWDLNVAEWDSIRLGVAVMLCDQALYSPSRRSGGPDWSKVSGSRPLRCVLGVAGKADAPRVESWLASMGPRFRLTVRERFEMNAAPPGRPPVLELYEVFEFVPREAGVGCRLPASAPVAGRFARDRH